MEKVGVDVFVFLFLVCLDRIEKVYHRSRLDLKTVGQCCDNNVCVWRKRWDLLGIFVL